jgi:hypothetical protein
VTSDLRPPSPLPLPLPDFVCPIPILDTEWRETVLAYYLATAEDIDSFGKPVFFFLRLSSQIFIIDNYRGFTADALFLTSLLSGQAPLTLRDPASTQTSVVH